MLRAGHLIFVASGVIALLTNCNRIPPDTTIPPDPACPAPKIDFTSWQTVTLPDCGIRITLPEAYREHRYDVVVNNAVGHSYRARDFDRIDIDLDIAQEANASLNESKVIRQKDYDGYTECTEHINGREAVIQSYRGDGGITDGTREFRIYSVQAVFSTKARSASSSKWWQ